MFNINKMHLHLSSIEQIFYLQQCNKHIIAKDNNLAIFFKDAASKLTYEVT